jgi:hypothetical protein
MIAEKSLNKNQELKPHKRKYLQRLKTGQIYFRAKGKAIARLPNDETSPEFTEAYDRLLGELKAGLHGEGRKGRPSDSAPASSPKKGSHVYFAQSGNLVKIGFASCLGNRLSQMRCDSAEPITLLGVVRGPRAIEELLHWQFAKYWKHGEWFSLEGRLADFVAEHFPAVS